MCTNHKYCYFILNVHHIKPCTAFCPTTSYSEKETHEENHSWLWLFYLQKKLEFEDFKGTLKSWEHFLNFIHPKLNIKYSNCSLVKLLQKLFEIISVHHFTYPTNITPQMIFYLISPLFIIKAYINIYHPHIRFQNQILRGIYIIIFILLLRNCLFLKSKTIESFNSFFPFLIPWRKSVYPHNGTELVAIFVHSMRNQTYMQ